MKKLKWPWVVSLDPELEFNNSRIVFLFFREFVEPDK